MGKCCLMALMSLAVAGCMAPAPKPPSNWTIAFDPAPVFAAAVPRFGPVRLAQVVVRAPYDGTRLCVLRADGSMAFDPCNVFAAQPASLLRGAAADAMTASGLFARVFHGSSSARTSLLAEVVVSELALDCRQEGERKAVVSLSLLLLDVREAKACVAGRGEAPVKDGNFSAAFSMAFTGAIASALSGL